MEIVDLHHGPLMMPWLPAKSSNPKTGHRMCCRDPVQVLDFLTLNADHKGMLNYRDISALQAFRVFPIAGS